MNHSGSILVVEDEPDLAQPLCDLLRAHGYEVEHAPNGAEALARLTKADPPALILLDLMMPVMDGWQFLAERKRDPSAAPLRVVVMSGDLGARAQPVEADAFVAKPFESAELLATVARLMKAERGRQEEVRDLRLDQLASLGRLAAGMAHEINNPLTYVTGNLELLDEDLGAQRPSPKLEQWRELVRGAIDGAERIGRVVAGLKTLARPADDPVGPVELESLLDSALHLASNDLGHRARVVRDFKVTATVRASASRLTQLFLNLLLTAGQRLPEGGADENELSVRVRAGAQNVVVEIRDSGTPLTVEGQRHLSGGLGMAICRQLAAELGVQLQIESRGEAGGLLRVILPAATPPSPPPLPSLAAGAVERASLLIIDDEPRIVSLLERALGRQHRVTALTSAREALTRIEAGESWDLILCDMMMPEMTGMELHAELVKRWPLLAARMVFITGGAFTPRAQAFLDHVPNPRMEKPIDLVRLRALVQSSLVRH